MKGAWPLEGYRETSSDCFVCYDCPGTEQGIEQLHVLHHPCPGPWEPFVPVPPRSAASTRKGSPEHASAILDATNSIKSSLKTSSGGEVFSFRKANAFAAMRFVALISQLGDLLVQNSIKVLLQE